MGWELPDFKRATKPTDETNKRNAFFFSVFSVSRCSFLRSVISHPSAALKTERNELFDAVRGKLHQCGRGGTPCYAARCGAVRFDDPRRPLGGSGTGADVEIERTSENARRLRTVLKTPSASPGHPRSARPQPLAHRP